MVKIIESKSPSEEKITFCHECHTTLSYQEEDLFKFQIPNTLSFSGFYCPCCGAPKFIKLSHSPTQWHKTFQVPFTVTFVEEIWKKTYQYIKKAK